MSRSEVRNTIVETASRLFYRNGYNLTGINEIIKEAGVAKATLYHHFRSKDEICLAYLQHKNNTFIRDIRSFTAQPPKGKKRVLALFGFLLAFFDDQDFNGCWCIKTASEVPKDDEVIKTEIQSQKNGLIDFIEELINGNLKNVTPKKSKSLARQVYLLYEGAVAESHLHQSNWPIKAAQELCAQIIA